MKIIDSQEYIADVAKVKRLVWLAIHKGKLYYVAGDWDEVCPQNNWQTVGGIEFSAKDYPNFFDALTRCLRKYKLSQL